MKNISRWAKANPIASRILIVLSHVLVVVNSLILGSLLFASNWGESRYSVVILANLFFILYVSYPHKGAEVFLFRYSYGRQKFYDFSLVLVYSAVIACGVNTILTYAGQDSYSAPPSVSKFISYRSEPGNDISSQPTVNTKESVRTKIKHRVQAVAEGLRKPTENSGSDAAKILLFLLSIAATILLGSLIASLACNLACSGAGGLALVVLILGLGGLLWLEIIAIRAIGRLHSKRKTSSPVENPI